MDFKTVFIDIETLKSPDISNQYPFAENLKKAMEENHSTVEEGIFHYKGKKMFYQHVTPKSIKVVTLNTDSSINIDFIKRCYINGIKKRCDSIRGFAHNINSPLTGIGSRLGLLRIHADSIQNHLETNNTEKALKSVEKLKADIDKIENAYEKIQTMTNKVPEFSNNEDDHHEGLVSPKALIETMLSYYDTNLFFKHKIACNVEIEKGCNFIKIAPADFIEPIIHIIDNCIYYFKTHDKRGELDIKLTSDDDFLFVDISNNGNHIATELADNIFKPYTGEFTDRCGVGLAFSRALFDRLGGHIELAKNEDGHVEFRLSFPRK